MQFSPLNLLYIATTANLLRTHAKSIYCERYFDSLIALDFANSATSLKLSLAVDDRQIPNR